MLKNDSGQNTIEVMKKVRRERMKENYFNVYLVKDSLWEIAYSFV